MSNASSAAAFAAKTLLRLAALLAGAAAAAFLLVSLSPVDPLQANIGQAALGSMSPEQIAQLERYWGVDAPAGERFLSWAAGALRGDLGVSLLYRRSVSAVIAEKLANSLWLMAFAWLSSGLIGFGLGVLCALWRDRPADRIIRVWCYVTASTPAFWLALLLLMVFAVWLKVLPVGLSVPIGVEASAVSTADRIRHAVLPALTLCVTGISQVALHTREKMIDVLESDCVLFARARGEGEMEVVLRHGLRGVALPALTLQFASISEIIGGSVLVEQVFSYPGLGQAAVTAGLGGDVPLLLGLTVISTSIVFAGNLAANLLYGLVDPRIRRGGSR